MQPHKMELNVYRKKTPNKKEKLNVNLDFLSFCKEKTKGGAKK